MGRKKTTGKRKKTVKVASTRHKDKRENIPTEELRGFVAEGEQQPQEVTYRGLLYARDLSLDPQLVLEGQGRTGPRGTHRPGRPGLPPGEDSAPGHCRGRAVGGGAGSDLRAYQHFLWPSRAPFHRMMPASDLRDGNHIAFRGGFLTLDRRAPTQREMCP